MALKDDLLLELDALIKEATRLDGSFRIAHMGTYESDIPEAEHRAFATSAKAAIVRVAGETSEYYKSFSAFKVTGQLTVPGHSPTFIPALKGSLMALRAAVDQGLLESLETRLRANFHDDFLDQSEALLSAGYHVAAMVIIGGVLEDHLRKLCSGRGLAWAGKGSLSKYNELLRDEAYSQPVWRRIQAVTDVRNNAAHGKGLEVAEDDVKDAQDYARRFLADYPA